MRLMSSKELKRGDTLIEVMFAFAIFSLVAVGAISIMNQGTANAQRSLEITLVRAQMDAQAETIRYMHKAYVATFEKGGTAPTGPAAEWLKITDKATGKGANQVSAYGQTNGAICPTTVPGQKPFVVNARTAKLWGGSPSASPSPGSSMPPFAQVSYNSDSSVQQAYGIWIESIPSPADPNGTGFVDFHIRACWDGAGSSAPITLGTIVRLYEPR